MRATILGLALNDIADPAIESQLEPNTYPALDATAYQRLDGTTIYAGTAAANVDRELDRIYVTEDSIHVEARERTVEETVACEWIADLEAGWVGVDTADGDWLFEALGSRKGTHILEATIDVDGFADHLQDYPRSSAWNVTQSRSLDEDDDAEESVIAYHDAAHLSDTTGSRTTTMLGFRYEWDGTRVRGTIAESGYVALFEGGDRPGTYAAWLNSQVLPFAELPEEFQGHLGASTTDQEVSADVE